MKGTVMAHEFETGFFVNQPAWHGLGAVVTDYPSREKARELAGLTWEPIMVPSYRFSGIDSDGALVHTAGDGVVGDYTPDEGFNRVVRSDTGVTLAHASDAYTLIGHGEMFDLLEMVLDQPNVKYETAGVLRGGKAVWVLVKLDEPITLPGDPSATMPYMVLLNRHDGTGACRLLPTMIRVVCMNTFRMAEFAAQRSNATYKFVHRRNWRDRVDEVRDTVHGVRDEVKAYERVARELLGIPVKPAQTREFVNRFVPMPEVPEGGKLTDRQVARVEDIRAEVWKIMISETTRDVAGTAYGWIQAATEYADHGRTASTPEIKFTRSMVQADPLKTSAFRITRELVGV